MDSELKRWEARQQPILMCWKAISDRSGNLHQTSRPDLGRYVWTRSGTLPQTSQLNYESPLNRRLVFFAHWFLRALAGAHLKSAFKNNCSSRPRCQMARAWQPQNCKSLFVNSLRSTLCKALAKLERFMWMVVSCHLPHKILFVNVSFAAPKGTFSNYFLNLWCCVTVTICFLRLHLVEEELLQAVGTATNKSIPLRGNSCAV